MYRKARKAVLFVVFSMLTTLLTVVFSETANAAPYIPPLRWSAVNAAPYYSRIVTSPAGTVTVGCSNEGAGQDLVTYNTTGVQVRQIPRTTQIDGVSNCIGSVIVDKNETVYGVPYGKFTSGGWGFGPNLLAYSGNTLKWKYPVVCGPSQPSQYVVGANGNIYVTVNAVGGVHLIGLAPNPPVGQTQPTKVLDIKVPNDCSMKIYPYKDGLMLHGQSSGGANYYSYSGKFLGQTNGDVWYEKMNADGRLFSPSYTIGGGFTSTSVSAYDPKTNLVTWKTQVSGSGANANGIWLSPLPNGGVMALSYEQKMTASGIPALPIEWVYSLVQINSSGQKLAPVILPNVKGTSAYYGRPNIITDTSGKVVIERQLMDKTAVGYPAAVSTIEIAVLNLATNITTYLPVRGNADGTNPATMYGYVPAYVGDNGPVTGVGTVFIQAQCQGNGCSDTATKTYPISVAGIGLGYPQGTILNTTVAPQPAPQEYVALGDSFSSGEGVVPFEDGTDTPYNTCHRSLYAYARLLSQDPNTALSLKNGGFQACSGATTAQITTSPGQIQWSGLGVNTKVVTVTIGGNDIRFSNFARACVLDSCYFNSQAYVTSKNLVATTLPGLLDDTYKKVLLAAPTAQIFVLGYPQIAPTKTRFDTTDVRCAYMYDSGYDSTGTVKNPPWGDAAAASDIVVRLNLQIAQSVTSVGNPRLHYVDVNVAGSPFVGHNVCSAPGDAYFNNVDTLVSGLSFVFHPNARGQQAYATLIRSALSM